MWEVDDIVAQLERAAANRLKSEPHLRVKFAYYLKVFVTSKVFSRVDSEPQ
jgi:hypothetical protein